MQLLQNGKQQFIDQNGLPLANGTVGYYAPGTLNPLSTYQDQAGTIQNTNPITLDSRGQAIVWGTGTYRQIVKDSSGVPIWDQIVTSSASAADLSSQNGVGGAAMIGFDGGSLVDFFKSKSNRLVDSIATLRTVSKNLYTRALVDGSTKAGFGFYWCDLSDTTTADDGWRTIVAADGGRWKRAEGAMFDVTLLGVTAGTTTSQSAAIAAAQVVCAAAGKIPYLPAGTYSGSIAFRASNTGIVGEGSSVTTLRLPSTTYGISSLSMTSGIATVTTSMPSGVFVGQGVSVQGTSVLAYNTNYLVTSVISSTQFTCKSLNYTFVDGAATGGLLSEGNVCEGGQFAYANSSVPISNVLVHGITFDGNRSVRPSPPDDMTDWGIGFCNVNKYHLSDVRGINCWQGGIGIFINSNFGYAQGYVENCGYSAQTPPGFDVNSSKYSEFHIVSKDCLNGARVLDNCFGNVGDFMVQNATHIGFVYGNQAVNQSYANNFRVTVIGGCDFSGVQVLAKCYSSQLDVSVQGVTGNGIHEVEGNGANESEGNTYRVNTKNCGFQSAIIGGSNGHWTINSWQDGRTGSPGSSFAVDIWGNRNQVSAVVEDSTTPQIGGVIFRSGATNNDIVKFTHNTLVQDFSDTSGAVNFFEEAQWANASFAAGWSNTYGAPYNTSGYKKCGRSVRLKGSASGASGTIFSLPAGYRPVAGKYIFPTVANGGVATVSIDTSGNVALMSGSGTAVNLDHISFAIDA